MRESEDLACGVFDPQGRMIGQSSSGTPGHINAMATGVRHFTDAFPPEALAPGDVLLTNDPWMTAGQVNDITVATPVFRAGRLLAFFVSTCHAPDIGGRLLSAEAANMCEEGLRLPLMKLARGGRMKRTSGDRARDSRTPGETIGDLYAQAAANGVGARSLLRCLNDLGSTRSTRSALRSAAAPRTRCGARSPRCRTGATRRRRSATATASRSCSFAVTLRGDELEVDFAGSSPQSRHGINVVLNYTHAYASFALKSAIAPEVPHNAGSFRPVRVTAPAGSSLTASLLLRWPRAISSATSSPG